MQDIRAVATAQDPHAALEQLLEDLQCQYNATTEEMQEACAEYEKQLAAELRRRKIMTELWPTAPAECFIYASFVRPFSEYGAAPAQVQAQQHQAANWPASVPHSYVASTEPLELLQVELLRLPLI